MTHFPFFLCNFSKDIKENFKCRCYGQQEDYRVTKATVLEALKRLFQIDQLKGYFTRMIRGKNISFRGVGKCLSQKMFFYFDTKNAKDR